MVQHGVVRETQLFNSQKIYIEPQQDDVLIFPSRALHEVPPNRGSGVRISLACDIVVAGPGSSFALTEARIGVAPAIISLTLLPKMTARAAGRYYLTGETFTAAIAVEIGLVTVATTDPDAELADIVEALGKGSPQGLAASKALTTASILAGFDRDAERLTVDSARLFVSDEAREGMLAFLQKRPPTWAEPGAGS